MKILLVGVEVGRWHSPRGGRGVTLRAAVVGPGGRFRRTGAQLSASVRAGRRARNLRWVGPMPLAVPTDLVREIVARQLPILEDHLEEVGRSLLGWQRTALNRLSHCCEPQEGFALLRCADCDQSRVVPFTCAVRGVCGTCGGRTMSSRAAAWVDSLFPKEVSVRQWVLTVPWPRRFLLARHPGLTREVLSTALEVIFGWYSARCEAQTGRPGETGSVTVIQRFSSSLALNVHFHILAVDAACVEQEDGTVLWHSVGPLTTEDVESLVTEVAARVEAMLARRGYPADEPTTEEELDDTTPLLDAAAAGRAALGVRAGRRTRRNKPLPSRPWSPSERCAEASGYNLHAGVVVRERDALERLCRYVNRPIFSKERLTLRDDGIVQLTLRRPWADGTTSFLFSELELVERMVALLAPPHVNQVLYHGVLGARSRLRSRVVPTPTEPSASRGALRTHGPPRKSDRWTRWADLLFRVFGVEGFACGCGGTLVLHAVVLPPATLDVLDSLKRSARAPPGGTVVLPPPAHLPPPPTPRS